MSASALARKSRHGGILEEPEKIGAEAIEILAGNFCHGERVSPGSARKTLIEGVYFNPGAVAKAGKARPQSSAG